MTSWHFMMRSAEYCAKLAKGAFDTDKVLRKKDVKFFIKGQPTLNFARADEVRVTFGKTKTTGGGEVIEGHARLRARGFSRRGCAHARASAQR